jgi:hypothetical protein
LLILADHVGHLFKGEAEFVRVDELRDQGDVLARKSIVESDEKAVQLPGDLFVVRAIHPRIVPDERTLCRDPSGHADVRATLRLVATLGRARSGRY